jgi:hypothetical protein
MSGPGDVLGQFQKEIGMHLKRPAQFQSFVVKDRCPMVALNDATPLGLPGSEVPACGGRMNQEEGVGTQLYQEPYRGSDDLRGDASFGDDGGTSDPADRQYILELQRELRKRKLAPPSELEQRLQSMGGVQVA